MADYKGHLTGGCVFALVLYAVFTIGAAHFDLPFFKDFTQNLPTLTGLFGIAVLFSLFPDIDTNSKGQDIFYLLFLIADIYLLLTKSYLYSAILGLLAILPIIGKHRGWTHTLWACCIVPLPFIIVPAYLEGKMVYTGVPYYVAAVTGYFSHLVVDGKYR